MIEVKDLHKSFDDREVLKGISTVFEDGKTNLIIGQSGSGKTVLMKNLVGLFEPTSGQVLYDGRDFVRMTKQEKVMMRREMGMIFQSAALFDSLTVLENVMFPLDMFSSMTYRERKERAMYCLDRVNLVGSEKKYPGEISGGMQKRVAIARAISLNPKYLFCDEPNSGLDPKTSLVIDDLLHSITQEFNMTTIINTHDMNSVMGIGENIIFIYEGHKEWQGVSSEIMNSTNQRLTDFIFASDLLEGDARCYYQEMNIQITFRRTSRLSMRIVKNGDVHVSAPIGLSRRHIEAFVEEHRDWINEARKRTLDHQKQRAAFYDQLPLHTKAQAEDAYNRLKALVEPIVERYAKVMGVRPSSVYYKATISRWGQCNVKDRSICISAYVLLLPDWCVEHVVVHEMCHLLEPSHNVRFHALMDRFFPRWREARKKTREICQDK